jgi:hypothetical protein
MDQSYSFTTLEGSKVYLTLLNNVWSEHMALIMGIIFIKYVYVAILCRHEGGFRLVGVLPCKTFVDNIIKNTISIILM